VRARARRSLWKGSMGVPTCWGRRQGRWRGRRERIGHGIGIDIGSAGLCVPDADVRRGRAVAEANESSRRESVERVDSVFPAAVGLGRPPAV
jgi:hypothetical protein